MAFALDDRGGGQALPPYLQGRTPTPRGPYQTAPMITPKSMVTPGEVRPTGFNPVLPRPMAQPINGSMITPRLPQIGAMAPGQPAANASGNDTKTLFEFLKKDLENERNNALSNARSSAAGRGVYYGTPLTTSEGDINTSFLRGLGQLQSGLIQNEQQNELQRLGLASNLIGSPPSFSDLAQQGQGNPDVYQTIGSLFAGQQVPGQPAITPAVQKPAATPIQAPFRPGQQTPVPLKPFNPFSVTTPRF